MNDADLLPPVAARTDSSEDYRRVARAIEFIRARADAQPSLEEVASALELSPFHLQRLFSRWAGISPKRFLQAVTLERAKELLRGETDLLTASLDAGLSSPGRLHDLFVTLEGVTPGEFKSGGEGLAIRHGFAPTPLGEAFVAVTGRGICALEFPDSAVDRRSALERVRHDWPGASLSEGPDVARGTLAGVFPARTRPDQPLSVIVRGTNFQVQVWRALLGIPRGQTVSYSEVARRIGRPDAVRAVAGAVGANRVSILIPCHRVLRQGGGLGGYRWGETRKLAALAWEAA